MRDFFRKPAVHVLILGLIVAAVILIAKGPPTGDAARRVVITGGDVLQLRAGFMRTWQREPTPEELRGALEQHIRQEVLYREALARGYDRDDQVVRRAMQQKMEFLAASQALQEPPSEEEVEAFFSLRQDRYTLPAALTFAQVYVSPDRRGADVEVDAQELLERLRREDPDPAELLAWGDPIMLETYYSDRSEADVSGTFGGEFADALLALHHRSRVALCQGRRRQGRAVDRPRVHRVSSRQAVELRRRIQPLERRCRLGGFKGRRGRYPFDGPF
jgi:hypothetical protein